MDIYGARDFIVTTLQVLLDGIVNPKEVQTHRGQFESLQEIQTIAARSPAVRVAFRALQDSHLENAVTVGNVLWVIHVFATDQRAEARNTLAGGIALKINALLAAKAAHWSFARDEAQQLSAVDLSTLTLDKAGISLWQITWSQLGEFTFVDPFGQIVDWKGVDGSHFDPEDDSENGAPRAETTINFPE
jgi:hypothetical protein